MIVLIWIAVCFIFVDALNNHSSNIFLFLFIHSPSCFALVYVFCETKLWFYQLANSTNYIRLCVILTDFLELNEYEIYLCTSSTNQPFLKRWAKISSISYLFSLSFCFGLLFSAEDDVHINNVTFYFLWRRLFYLQSVFFLWLIIRFVLSPIFIQ
jgi:hypothetical protein